MISSSMLILYFEIKSSMSDSVHFAKAKQHTFNVCAYVTRVKNQQSNTIIDQDFELARNYNNLTAHKSTWKI